MQTKRELYQAAMRTICARRQAAKADAQDARHTAEAAVPGLAEAEADFRQCGIDATLAAATGGSTAAALSRLNTARIQCETLLKASGRPANCLDPKFTCPLCQDTGMVNGHVCTCVQQLMRRLRRDEIEAASSLSISRFDTMELRYYPDQADLQTGRSARRHMQQTLEDLHQYAEEFDHDSSNLLLIGNAGLGKTHAALAIAGIVLDKGYDVIYLSSPEFFSRLEKAHFGNASEDEQALLTAASEADLLILDDLGTEMVSTYMLSNFYTLLNNRMAAHRPMIFTSNIMDGTLFEKLYTEKIASRLAGSCEQFVFLGTDIRQLKAAEQ